MSDPRNVAHDKKVIQEKKHHGEKAVEGAAETVQPGKKPTIGDYIAAFRESGLEVDITDFSRLVFKPKLHVRTTVVSLKVVRTYQVI